MDTEKNAFELIELIYDAALAPERWEQVMKRFIATVGTNTAILRDTNYKASTVGLFKTIGYDPFYVDAYKKHFIHLDFFTTGLLKQIPGQVSRGDDYIPWTEQRNSEFYNDYLRPQNNRYCLGITLSNDSDHNLLFALQRTKKQGDFTDEEIKFISLVAPHMKRAIGIHRQVLKVTNQQKWTLSTLNQLKIGVILLDDLAKPVFINQKAEQLMMDNCGLSIHRDSLILSNTLDSARLQHFIADAANMANGKKDRLAIGASLQTFNTLGAPLRIQVIPLPRDKSERPWELSSPNGCVALFFSTSNQAHLNVEALCKTYGFTPAESKLAALLANGYSLEEIARMLCISIQTVRSQLKAVFAKTQANRQTELVALLLTDMLSHKLTD